MLTSWPEPGDLRGVAEIGPDDCRPGKRELKGKESHRPLARRERPKMTLSGQSHSQQQDSLTARVKSFSHGAGEHYTTF